MQQVIAVTATERYVIRVRFADGMEGTIDLSQMIGQGVFTQLADADAFAQVYVDAVTHTVAWPQGIDLCPDTLYEDICSRQHAA